MREESRCVGKLRPKSSYYCKHNITSINYGVCLGTPTALTAVDTVGECTILIGQ